MSRKFWIGLVLLAALVIGVKSASAGDLGTWGMAKDNAGNPCGSTCTAFFQDQTNNIPGSGHTYSGPVAASAWSCLIAYNFGNPTGAGTSGCYEPNPYAFLHSYSIQSTVIDTWVWIRKPCPASGGFFFSQTNHNKALFFLVFNGVYGYTATPPTLQLQDPRAGCHI